MWNVKTKVTSIQEGQQKPSQNHQKILEPHIRRAQNKGTAENSHIGHCTHTSESTNLKVQQI
jgi:hypothetical protein